MTLYDSDRLRVGLATVLDIGRTAVRAVAPIVDLLVRLSLAKAFFAPGMLPDGDIGDFHATWPIIAAQVTGPVLLAAGLFVRPLSLLMLVLTLSTQSLGAPQDEHLFWAALFGWYALQGAGPLSLDHVLDKGLTHSPLPLAGPAMAALRWVSREVGPFYLLAIRLWLATALTGPVTMHAMLPTMEVGMVPRPLAIVGAALLALGLLTPVVAAGLLAGASGMAMAGADQGMTIYGALLLALLGVFGAGHYSLDRLIIDWAHRALPVDESAPHVVIVGAGFGGMACAAGLRHERARVTLIDRHNYHLFQPLLYQVATAALSPADIATPIRGVFRDNPRLRVLCGTVTAVDAAARRSVSYTHLTLPTN